MLYSDKHSSRFYKLCSNAYCGLEGRIKPLECGTDRQNFCTYARRMKTEVEPVRANQAVPKTRVTTSSPCSLKCGVLRCK